MFCFRGLWRRAQVLEDKRCFLEYIADDAKAVEDLKGARHRFTEALRSVPGRLGALGFGLGQLFQVVVGATLVYGALRSSEGGQATLLEVERFFRDLVPAAGLDASRGLAPDPELDPEHTGRGLVVDFRILEGEDEGRLEWLAVKTACAEDYSHDGEPFACVAGGNGSIQVSTEFTSATLDSPLKEAAAECAAGGVEAYRARVRPQVVATFNSAAVAADQWGRSIDNPLRLVIISAFYYASLACKATSKGDFVRWRDVGELLGPAGTLLADGTADPRDRANVARLVEVLEALTKGDFQHVQVLLVLEWTVRGKDYKATWVTGMFLSEMRERQASIMRRQQRLEYKHDLRAAQSPRSMPRNSQSQSPTTSLSLDALPSTSAMPRIGRTLSGHGSSSFPSPAAGGGAAPIDAQTSSHGAGGPYGG